MSRFQLNVRVEPDVEAAIDARRVELSSALGRIPSRSDVVRLALEAYLGIKIGSGDDEAPPDAATKARRMKTAKKASGKS